MRQYAALLERRVQSSTRVRKAQVVTRQTKHIRNLLPQCASDATGFLSDVYKKSTRAQKFLADGVQCGRSMIEMLGVLAIIAVLSVGGIAGYSKAMRAWRSNQQRNMITELIASAIKIKPNLNPKSTSFDNITPVLNAMGDIPEGMTYQNNYIYDKDGNYSDITYGLMTNSYTNAQYFMYVIRFYFRGNGNYLTPSVKDFCYNVVSAAKSLANEVLRIELVQSNSQSESGGSSTRIFSKKDLQTATPIDIQKKCDIVLIDSNRKAHFNIQLNPK